MVTPPQVCSITQTICHGSWPWQSVGTPLCHTDRLTLESKIAINLIATYMTPLSVEDNLRFIKWCVILFGSVNLVVKWTLLLEIHWNCHTKAKNILMYVLQQANVYCKYCMFQFHCWIPLLWRWQCILCQFLSSYYTFLYQHMPVSKLPGEVRRPLVVFIIPKLLRADDRK